MNQETFNEIHSLVSEWEGKENHRIPADVITRIFNAHNKAHPEKPEYSKGCSGCRQRTWDRLKTYYHTNKHIWGY